MKMVDTQKSCIVKVHLQMSVLVVAVHGIDVVIGEVIVVVIDVVVVVEVVVEVVVVVVSIVVAEPLETDKVAIEH